MGSLRWMVRILVLVSSVCVGVALGGLLLAGGSQYILLSYWPDAPALIRLFIDISILMVVYVSLMHIAKLWQKRNSHQ